MAVLVLCGVCCCCCASAAATVGANTSGYAVVPADINSAVLFLVLPK